MPTQQSDWQTLLDGLASSATRISLVVTGGGSGAVSRCLRRAGASRNFVDAAAPYSRAAVADYLGTEPAGAAASGEVARQLGAAALARAFDLDDVSQPPERAGIGLAAALPTTPPRPVRNRIHVALQRPQHGVLWSLELATGTQTRESAETIADEMVYRALAELAGSAANDAFFDRSGLALQRVDFDDA